ANGLEPHHEFLASRSASPFPTGACSHLGRSALPGIGQAASGGRAPFVSPHDSASRLLLRTGCADDRHVTRSTRTRLHRRDDMTAPTMLQRLAAETFGTFWLVFGGCGSAVFAATVQTDDGVLLGIGFLGVSLAFGLTVLTRRLRLRHRL